jgi:hypothetical protein
MKETNLQKVEVLWMLSGIYGRLEELNAAFHTSIKEYRRDCQAEHFKRLSDCEERLSILETKMNSVGREEDKKSGRETFMRYA